MDIGLKTHLKTLERLVPRLASEGHQIILLSHLGIDLDTLIAESYPEIQVILGAHTHHLFKEGKRVNPNTLNGWVQIWCLHWRAPFKNRERKADSFRRKYD